jgi:hypothetical protein
VEAVLVLHVENAVTGIFFVIGIVESEVLLPILMLVPRNVHGSVTAMALVAMVIPMNPIVVVIIFQMLAIPPTKLAVSACALEVEFNNTVYQRFSLIIVITFFCNNQECSKKDAPFTPK